MGAPLNHDIRAAADMDALRRDGVLPKISGLYMDDQPDFDAILLSHAHLDHSGLLTYAHPDIPLVLSEGSNALMELGARFLGQPAVTNERIVFEMYRTFSIADIQITPYLMDHSAFDAAAFEILADGRRIVYTGDFRRHGRKGASFEHFLDRAARRAGRKMVIDRYTAATLAELRKLGNQLPTVRTHTGLSIHRPQEPHKTLMLVRPSMLDELRNDDTIQNGVFFYSLWNGYRSQPGQMELEAFLSSRGVELVEAHTSGHADSMTLQRLLSKLNPKQIIPIHTLSPERFTAFSNRVRVVRDGEVVEC